MMMHPSSIDAAIARHQLRVGAEERRRRFGRRHVRHADEARTRS